ncbi:MAG TPA: hypothetical protein VIJ59_07150 [Caulobacteraceae bacterium]
MTAQAVPTLNIGEAIVEPKSGRPTDYFFRAWQALTARTGGESDKVDAAHALASGAVPQGTEVIAGGGLQVGGALGGNVGLALYAAVAPVASLPTAEVSEGDWAYALDGLKSGESSGSGTGTPVWRSAGAWYAAWSGLAVTS